MDKTPTIVKRAQTCPSCHARIVLDHKIGDYYLAASTCPKCKEIHILNKHGDLY